jgi:hypothetical protein
MKDGGTPMRKTFWLLALLSCLAVSAVAADTPAASIPKVLDSELSSLERELVPLAEAMPAEKYGFAPTNGAFDGVRTFRLEMTHIATVIDEMAAGILGEKLTIDLGEHENGAASLQTKEQVVKYLKDSVAYGHKAMLSLTNKNFTDMVPSPFSPNDTIARGYLAEIIMWHSYDHYGQAVEYLRMNGIVPPASRR